MMAGSMDSFNPPFVPLFDLAIHITASIDTRIDRIHKREYEGYGERIMKGGYMYEGHCRFIDNSSRYDTEVIRA